MSVSSFIKMMYDSDLDFSNVNVNDFCLCVKRLNEILAKAGSDARTAVRKREFNSSYAKQLYECEKFNPRVFSSVHCFTDETQQIDICIRQKCFYVSVCGAYQPNLKALLHLLQLTELNFAEQFDFSNMENFHTFKGCFQFYGGKDFPVNEIGLKRIYKVWFQILQMYLSHKYDIY